MDTEEQSQAHWQQLRELYLHIDDEWETNWRGPNADHFRRDFWYHFEWNITAHLRALVALHKAMRMAQNTLDLQ